MSAIRLDAFGPINIAEILISVLAAPKRRLPAPMDEKDAFWGVFLSYLELRAIDCRIIIMPRMVGWGISRLPSLLRTPAHFFLIKRPLRPFQHATDATVSTISDIRQFPTDRPGFWLSIYGRVCILLE